MQAITPKTIFLKDYTVPTFMIETVDLTFTLAEDATLVLSHLTMRKNPESNAKSKELILQGESLSLVSISLDGKQLLPTQFEVNEHTLKVFSVPDNFTLTIETQIKPQENTSLSGLYKSSGNFCTQCEAEGFRRITYFLDRSDVMARYTTTIIANESQYPILLSNGNPVESGKMSEDRHWVRWEDPFKKPSYLFALIAGNLEFIEDYYTTMSGRRVIIRIYVEQGNLDKTAHAMLAVKKAMRWDEEKYGREYDLDIYMIVAVSDFNMGAMENKGLNIFNTKYILAQPNTATDEDFIHVESVIAHEYFHNWTGNRITCRDWFQLSLKEGLTVFRDQSFTADMTSSTVARIHDVNALRTQQFPEDAGPLAHPVCPASYIEINNFYTTTIYNKGAEVIRMIQTILGEKLFRAGMDLYFKRHDGQAVTIFDFVQAMQDASGIDLNQFRLWYTQAGTPTLKVQDDYEPITKKYTLTIDQFCPPTPGEPLKKAMHIPVKIGLIYASGKEHHLSNSLLEVKKTSEIFEFNNIESKPIPSILRHFSAPVKVDYPYTDAELTILFKHDSDPFNRWEAGQKYAINLSLRLVEQAQQNQPLTMPKDFLEAYRHVLLNQQEDKCLLAEMLILPSEKYLAEQMLIIDPDAIHHAREFMVHEIANYLKHEFLEIYQENHDAASSYEFTMEEMGKRQLKNLCLSYLMLLNDANIHEKLGFRQFKEELKHNMTDTMVALRTLTNIESPFSSLALEAFYTQWKNEALVVDKWFSVQASSKLPNTLDQVQALLKHEAFDIKNPNKVYSLIGAFSQNQANFHAKSGAAYIFLANIVQELDALNPQVAARMVKPLTLWRRYDERRQVLMVKELNRISQKTKISRDVFELVSKSLEKNNVEFS